MEEKIRFTCKNCEINISEEEMVENKGICPKCGSSEGWLSEMLSS